MKTAFQRWSLAASAATVTALSNVSTAFGAFAGPDPNIAGLATGADPRSIIERILVAVLNFLALIAVVIVVIAGIRLILSQGEEEAKEKAKKTIFYALIGLVIILFARVIVGLVTNYLASQVTTAP